MLGLFGKKKLKEKDLAKVFVGTLNDVAVNGYESIADFIKHDTLLDNKPELTNSNLEWFIFIVFTANLRNLNDHFTKDQLDRLRIDIIDEFSECFEGKNPDQIIEQINNYEDFISSINNPTGKLELLISKAIFMKFGFTNNQADLPAIEPNPEFIQALSELSIHFVWNWSDFLEKFKPVS